MSLDKYCLSPGGREYTLTAGQVAGLTKNSVILDIACGRATSSINLAKKFGMRSIAVDINADFIAEGKALAEAKGVADNIEFICGDILDQNFKKESFDLVLAEGGALSYIGRMLGLNLADKWLKPGGYLEISDMIIDDKKLMPSSFQKIYTDHGWNFETEGSYRSLLKYSGFEMIFCSYITKKRLLEYKNSITEAIKKSQGAFEDKELRDLFKEEQELFYESKWIDYFLNIFMVSKKIN